MRFPTMWYVLPAKAQTSLSQSLEYSMSVMLLTEHHLQFLSLQGGCTGSSEYTLVKITHCWKSHVTAQIISNIGHLVLIMVLLACMIGADVQLKVQVGMCTHQRLRSACASSQSDQSLQWVLYG